MEITLKLTIDQANAIVSALADLPIKTGLGQLIAEIVSQVQPQLPEQPAEEESAE